MIGIDRSPKLFKRIADPGMQFVQQGGLKEVTQEFVVDVFFCDTSEENCQPRLQKRDNEYADSISSPCQRCEVYR